MLSEIEDRLLVELEWAGEENFPTLLNSIFEPIGVEEEVEKVRDALSSMLIKRLIAIAVERNQTNGLVEVPTPKSIELIKNFDQHLIFKSDGGHWTGGARPWPTVVLTSLGRAEGREVLARRGYRWWRGVASE